jgi:hypothetical protein
MPERTMSGKARTGKAGKQLFAEKLRWQVLPWREIEELAAVFDFGARKRGEHGAHSWERMGDVRDEYAAKILRHFTEWRLGRGVDPESGRSHLYHLASDALILAALDRVYGLPGNRPGQNNPRKTPPA